MGHVFSSFLDPSPTNKFNKTEQEKDEPRNLESALSWGAAFLLFILTTARSSDRKRLPKETPEVLTKPKEIVERNIEPAPKKQLSLNKIVGSVVKHAQNNSLAFSVFQFLFKHKSKIFCAFCLILVFLIINYEKEIANYLGMERPEDAFMKSLEKKE